MEERLKEEIELISKYFPNVILSPCKKWILISKYKLPTDRNWNKEEISICINIPNGLPGVMPYGIYVPSDLRCNNQVPGSFQPNANNKPPFEGNWGMLSWSPVPGEWKPNADIRKGSNLYNFIRTFKDRFNEGT